MMLAIKLGRSLFATDDGKAIKAARFFKIPFIVTPNPKGEQIIKKFIINSTNKVLNSLADKDSYNFQ